MLRVVSLFCGCGGSDMGLYRAAEELGVEVEVVAAYDSWEPAVRVYNANLPHPVAQVADLKKMQRRDLPAHDLIIGGPPCQDHSQAGKRACKCNVGGPATERCCLADFVRLAGDSPYIMENVASRLINAPWSEKLCAADFGDVTSRKRWFYSNYLLHVIPTPGPRRIRDIRDHAEDARVLAKRSGCKAGNHSRYESDESLDSLTAHAWHGHDIRSGKLLGIGIRGHSGRLPSVRGDDDFMGVTTANDFHRESEPNLKIIGCRNPSLLEMQRAHSFPDSFDWCGATKAQRGQMIANSWPIGMATAVCTAMMRNLVPEASLCG